MRFKAILLVLGWLTFIGAAQASDAYFVRFNAIGGNNGEIAVDWRDDVLLYNTTAAPLTVTFLGVSNGAVQTNLKPAVAIPAHRTVSLNGSYLVTDSWFPVPAQTLWILHLDIPAGVVAESRDQFSLRYLSLAGSLALEKVSMPIFRDVVAAAQVQVHLGTDLNGTASRENVGVYNAGAVPATATIEVRRACDDKLLDSRSVEVPSDTVVQIGGLNTITPASCPDSSIPDGARYTTISVTQPSLTFVSNVSNSPAARLGGDTSFVPVVNLGVAKSERF
jgi:hypothetical protein